MEFVSTSKFLIISPRKVRPLAKQIQRFTPGRALAVLSVLNKSASQPLAKAIKTVLANAKIQAGISEEELVFKSIEVGEGPRLKRGRPVSRGRWHPFKRRMSHIRVVLASKTTNEKLKVQSAKLLPATAEQSKDEKRKN